MAQFSVLEVCPLCISLSRNISASWPESLWKVSSTLFHFDIPTIRSKYAVCSYAFSFLNKYAPHNFYLGQMQFLSIIWRVLPSVLSSWASNFLLFWGMSHSVTPVSIVYTDPAENREKTWLLQLTSTDPLTLCQELCLIMCSSFVCTLTHWDRCCSYVHSIQQTQWGPWDTAGSKIPDVNVGKTRRGKMETNRLGLCQWNALL